MIPPGDFLPVAQRSGLLRELDLWVLRAACTEAATWTGHDGRRPSVAVNLAGLLPGDHDFQTVVSWYRLLFATRQLDERASRYIRRGMGWSYHARCR